MYRPGCSDWHFHLQAGISIVTSWLDHQDQHFISHGSCRANTEKESDVNTIESAKVFFVGCIIRFDILSSLTRNSVPVLSGRYQQLFQASSYGIPLQASLQCRNWLFSILLDIYSLREWKDITEAAGVLSLRELISKAFLIKQTLERGISLNKEEIMSAKKDVESSCKSTSTRTRQSNHDLLVVTHIFACSVSIFLEVVLSGALPKLPEIQHEVSRAIESYAYINNSDLLNELHWPLCVAGCVAEPHQYDFFRSLLSSSNVVRIGAFRESLERLEECWRISACMKPTDSDTNSAKFMKFMVWDILIV